MESFHALDFLYKPLKSDKDHINVSGRFDELEVGCLSIGPWYCFCETKLRFPANVSCCFPKFHLKGTRTHFFIPQLG